VGFSADLVPAKAPAGKFEGNKFLSLFGKNDEIYVYAETPRKFEFQVEGSVVRGGLGPVRLRLFSDKNPIIGEPVAEAEVVADKKSHPVILNTPYTGLHKLEVSDGNGGSRISWPAGQKVAYPVAPDRQNRTTSNYKFGAVFYVPRNTQVVGGYIKTRGGQILHADGTVALDLSKLEPSSAFSIPVAAGQEGTWWRIENASAGIQLLTVPPFLARSPDEALLPSEVTR
jgi:hypothetical protein